MHLRKVKSKYGITDITGAFGERGNATLEVGWNVQPYVGALTWTTWKGFGAFGALAGGRSEPFAFPPIAGTKKKPTANGSAT